MNTLPKIMLLSVIALTVAATIPAWAAGERVTFTKDVLPILQENCQDCHRPSGKNMSGMIAPMSFMSYDEARPWAKAIARVVDSKEMPPWHASTATHGVFRNERTLTEVEIDTILQWVEQRAPRGNPKDAPEPKDFPQGWSMGEPDLIVGFPEDFFVADDVQDLYHNVTLRLTEEMLPEDKWVQAIEFRPGSEVVHHIIAYASDPEYNASKVDEDANLEEDEEFLRGRVMLGGLAPGTDPGDFPDGWGLPLAAGSDLTFAMHYHKEAGPGTGMWDNSVMAVKFHDKPVVHEMRIANIAHGAFEIPPHHGNWVVSGAKTFDEEITVLNLMPHTHLRGVESKYTAYYPDGTSEELLHTPKYDFNWQTQYYYNEPKVIPAGTRIEFEIVYDNSDENAERVGFDSSRAISFGGPTTDEMDLGWITYAKTGD